MKFALIISGSPHQSKACHSALAFAKSIVTHADHELIGVFFYEDSVLVANRLAQPPRDELNVTKAWQTLHLEHGIPLTVCIAAALRRGVLSDSEAKRHEEFHHSLADGFALEGLGSLVELTHQADKVIRFRP